VLRRGQIASREGEERRRWVLFARGGLGSACRYRKRFVDLGGSLGTASWTMSSGERAGLKCVLCQWAGARVQWTCKIFVTRPERVEDRACRARAACRQGFDAVQGEVRCERKRGMHDSER
jgi:hypothetical protein